MLKNLKPVLAFKIPDWAELLKSLRKNLKLSDERGKPGLRDIHALGLAFCKGTTHKELKRKLENEKDSIEEKI